MFPGWGQYDTWSHLIGLSTTALTLGGVYTSYAFIQSANNWYARYQADLSGYAPRKFTTAVSQRNNASTVAIATAVVWIGAAVEAEWQERVHASRLAAVHEFWFRPILTAPSGPSNIAPGLGAGLKFEFR